MKDTAGVEVPGGACPECGRGEVFDGKCDRCGFAVPAPTRPLAALREAEERTRGVGVPLHETFCEPRK